MPFRWGSLTLLFEHSYHLWPECPPLNVFSLHLNASDATMGKDKTPGNHVTHCSLKKKIPKHRKYTVVFWYIQRLSPIPKKMIGTPSLLRSSTCLLRAGPIRWIPNFQMHPNQRSMTSSWFLVNTVWSQWNSAYERERQICCILFFINYSHEQVTGWTVQKHYAIYLRKPSKFLSKPTVLCETHVFTHLNQNIKNPRKLQEVVLFPEASPGIIVPFAHDFGGRCGCLRCQWRLKRQSHTELTGFFILPTQTMHY